MMRVLANILVVVVALEHLWFLGGATASRRILFVQAAPAAVALVMVLFSRS